MRFFIVKSVVGSGRRAFLPTLRGRRHKTVESRVPVLLCVALLCAVGGCSPPEKAAAPEAANLTLADIRSQLREVPALLLKFGSKDPRDWEKACRELKSLSEELVPREIIRMAEDAVNPSSPTAERARQALERMGKIEMELTKLNVPDFNLWEDARKNLMAMGDDAVESLILKVISIFKRRSALHWDWAKVLLKRIGSPAIPYLVGFIESPSAPQSLRARCAEALVIMGKVAEDEVKKGAASTIEYVRQAYACGLGESRTRSSIELLRKLATDTDWKVRGFAMQSLSKIGGSEVVPILIAGLWDSEPVVQYKAAQGLEIAKDRRAIGPLIDLLKRVPKSEEVDLIRVDMAAAKALRAITGQKFGTDATEWERWYQKNQ